MMNFGSVLLVSICTYLNSGNLQSIANNWNDFLVVVSGWNTTDVINRVDYSTITT